MKKQMLILCLLIIAIGDFKALDPISTLDIEPIAVTI